ncbi:uncharacterized protein N7518_006148 [Penicillium psychrosexuale]|uniref:uncharacterized protein n=1 Tax=Penicillium psychrosexuale TaxID=1002107 RepID=UPI00254535CE|nr:uncharacterized protein N7518_006148 [Penicillium psychrosexuale]KAJ5789137.1 hypothetical protein N7518_006148 [Penicillium psychrosexuale]
MQSNSARNSSKKPTIAIDLHPVKIAIVGAGNVGASTAYALLLSGLAAEIVLIDLNRRKAEGEVMDLNHAAPFSHQTKITLGDLEDCSEAAIVIITAGANQKPGQSRLDLLRINAKIIEDIVPKVTQMAPSTILLIASNPVDVLTFLSWKLSGFPPSRVIGSGTVLDTARLRDTLGRRLDVDPSNIHADVIGEHGDSELPVWSRANISGIPLAEFSQQAGQDAQDIMQQSFQDTRNAAYEIIKLKGMTDYGISAGLVRIVETILRNENTLMTVSTAGTFAGVSEIALSMPKKVNRTGAHHVIDIKLSEEESRELEKSAHTIKSSIESLKS